MNVDGTELNCPFCGMPVVTYLDTESGTEFAICTCASSWIHEMKVNPDGEIEITEKDWLREVEHKSLSPRNEIKNVE